MFIKKAFKRLTTPAVAGRRDLLKGAALGGIAAVAAGGALSHSAKHAEAGGLNWKQAVRIKTDPDPYEPFNLALGYRVGNLVFISGQAALTQQGELAGVGDFDAQAEQTFQNLKTVLEAGGSGLDRIIKVNIYLLDMSNFQKIVDLRAKWFTKPYPADTIVEVTSLALPELMIEIDAIALVEGKIVG